MHDDTRGMLFESTMPTGHTVRVDVSPAFGGDSLGPEPKQLLLVSLGACTGLDVISILRKKRQDVTQYSINVYATEAEDHPKIYTSILVEHVVGGRAIDPKAVARSIELSIKARGMREYSTVDHVGVSLTKSGTFTPREAKAELARQLTKVWDEAKAEFDRLIEREPSENNARDVEFTV